MAPDEAGFGEIRPEISGKQLLMCCTCGRFLPQECFDLDHLIPQQALKQDMPVLDSRDRLVCSIAGTGTRHGCHRDAAARRLFVGSPSGEPKTFSMWLADAFVPGERFHVAR